MALSDDCREVAATMTDTDLHAALDILGPDSPLLPACRAEVRRRLEAHNTAATQTARKEMA